jgi:hypothetical protein
MHEVEVGGGKGEEVIGPIQRLLMVLKRCSIGHKVGSEEVTERYVDAHDQGEGRNMVTEVGVLTITVVLRPTENPISGGSNDFHAKVILVRLFCPTTL